MHAHQETVNHGYLLTMLLMMHWYHCEEVKHYGKREWWHYYTNEYSLLPIWPHQFSWRFSQIAGPTV